MRAIPRRLTFSLLLALLSCAPALAQEKHIQLLAHDTGWLLAGNRLLWTSDNGQEWRKITPPLSLEREKIANVYFKDVNNGWALLSTDENEKDYPEARFELATTTNSGASWSVTPVETPRDPNRSLLPGGGTIFFLDSAHGWLNLGLESGASFRASLLLWTKDGGATWTGRAFAFAGDVRFVSPQDGWIAGGPNGHQLYATTDGGAMWREIPLETARGAAAFSTCGVYGLPVFTDAKHGSALGPCLAGEAEKAAIFATDDAGRSWRVVKAFPRPPGWNAIRALGIAGTTWVVAMQDSSTLTLTWTDANGMRTKAAEMAAETEGVVDISFLTPDEGWVLTNRLLATEDGGATWRDISPWPAPRTAPSTPAPTNSPSGGAPEGLAASLGLLSGGGG